MKVVLVFRDSRKKGKSIEGLFADLEKYCPPSIEIVRWEYDNQRSIFKNRRSLLQLKGDIIHITGDVTYLSLVLPGQKIILTIHDIGRYKELHGFKKQVYKYFWLKGPIALARRIVTVSHFTKKDIIELLSAGKNKIQVIPNGIDSTLVPVTKEFNKHQPRILQVGTAHNKNIETVIQALAGINAKLIIIGHLSIKQQTMLNELGVSYENHTDLDMNALRNEYQKCDMVVFVSVHEGFGMPVVEAQKVGRPVITTRKASIPEVAGDGALFINDPYDANELQSAIHKVIMEDEFRESLIESGYKNSARYSYESMAGAYIKLYEETGKE